MLSLLASVNFATYTIADWGVFCIVLIVIVGLVYIMCQVAGVTIPGWVLKAIGLVIAGLVCIAGIKIIAS